jgi:hypothetical protein
MEKIYQRRLKAKLSLMECDLIAARKMLYSLELFTVEGFRNHLTDIQKNSEDVIRLILELRAPRE